MVCISLKRTHWSLLLCVCWPQRIIAAVEAFSSLPMLEKLLVPFQKKQYLHTRLSNHHLALALSLSLCLIYIHTFVHTKIDTVLCLYFCPTCVSCIVFANLTAVLGTWQLLNIGNDSPFTDASASHVQRSFSLLIVIWDAHLVSFRGRSAAF